MAAVVVFVHGTGVREQGWVNSFALVKQGVLGLDSAISVHGCFWGRSEGAELKADGASIPDYGETGGTIPRRQKRILRFGQCCTPTPGMSYASSLTGRPMASLRRARCHCQPSSASRSRPSCRPRN